MASKKRIDTPLARHVYGRLKDLEMSVGDIDRAISEKDATGGFNNWLRQKNRQTVRGKTTQKIAEELGWTPEELLMLTPVKRRDRPPAWQIAIWYLEHVVSPEACRQLASEAAKNPRAHGTPLEWGKRLWVIQDEIKASMAAGGLTPEIRSTVRPRKKI